MLTYPINANPPAQVYFGYPTADTDPEVPAKVLRYFKKTCAENTHVSYTFSDADVSNWDVGQKRWVVTHGVYRVSVGSSSQDIRLQAKLEV